jgi:hypothetical protein
MTNKILEAPLWNPENAKMAIPFCGECKHGLTRQSDKFSTCGCALMPSPLTDWEQGMVSMELTDMVKDLTKTPILHNGEHKTTQSFSPVQTRCPMLQKTKIVESERKPIETERNPISELELP